VPAEGRHALIFHALYYDETQSVHDKVYRFMSPYVAALFNWGA